MKLKIYTVYNISEIQNVLEGNKPKSVIKQPNISTGVSDIPVIGCTYVLNDAEIDVADYGGSENAAVHYAVFFEKDSSEIYIDTEEYDLDEFPSSRLSDEEINTKTQQAYETNSFISLDDLQFNLVELKNAGVQLYGTVVKDIKGYEVYKITKYDVNDWTPSNHEIIYMREGMPTFQQFVGDQ